eukprot:scaffold284638_cov32-Tisochrysis_lutea.AAC.3
MSKTRVCSARARRDVARGMRGRAIPSTGGEASVVAPIPRSARQRENAGRVWPWRRSTRCKEPNRETRSSRGRCSLPGSLRSWYGSPVPMKTGLKRPNVCWFLAYRLRSALILSAIGSSASKQASKQEREREGGRERGGESAGKGRRERGRVWYREGERWKRGSRNGRARQMEGGREGEREEGGGGKGRHPASRRFRSSIGSPPPPVFSIHSQLQLDCDSLYEIDTSAGWSSTALLRRRVRSAHADASGVCRCRLGSCALPPYM